MISNLHAVTVKGGPLEKDLVKNEAVAFLKDIRRMPRDRTTFNVSKFSNCNFCPIIFIIIVLFSIY
jgi:hypothetical protein